MSNESKLEHTLAASSLPQAFTRSAAGREGTVLFRKRLKKDIVTATWDQIRSRVDRMAVGLMRHGFEPGDRAALLADNGPDWAVADLAVQAAGGTTVPIYTTGSHEQLDHILRDSGSTFFLAGSKKYLAAAGPALDGRGADVRAVVLDEAAKDVDPELTLRRMLGGEPSAEELAELERRTAALTRNDVSAVIYTSGTTGPPKGVQLTHGNILSNLQGCVDILSVREGDVLLSLLPMSHSFERTAGFYAPLLHGATIHFAQSAGTLARDIVEARPTLAMVVPRFLEKMRQRIHDAIASRTGVAGVLARRALSVRLAAARHEAAGRRPPLHLLAMSALALRVIGGPIREKLGGRLRCMFAGGAALSPEVWAFYRAAGISVSPGYGLTETSPVISANPPGAVKAASVGVPLHNMDIRIAGDGEILARGPAVMKGYLGLPEETAGIIDTDGYLHTGDVGHIDEDGYLFITDRKKDIIVSAAGKNIAPQNVENALCLSPLIDYACVFGDGENFLAAVLSPDADALAERARAEGSAGDGAGLHELIARPETQALFQAEVDRANAGLGSYERVFRFHVTGEPFGMETGEITTTLKVKRKVVRKKYAAEIEKLFRPE